MRYLNDAEKALFREDYQERDAEVQRSFGLYLSGLALVSGWVVGPGARNIEEMIADNSGYNAYLFLGLVLLNLIFTCFLVHKSILIHEIMQFVTWLTPPDDALQLWESWRRSPQSVSRRVRSVYYLLIGLLPLGVSLLVMSTVHGMLISTAAPSLAVLDRLKPEIWWAFRIIAVLHVFPVWFMVVNAWTAGKKWDEILEAKSIGKRFEKLDAGSLPESTVSDPVSTDT